MLGLNDVAFLGSLSGAGGYDPDAQAYITAVEAADAQALEVGVKDAINDFVVGCKSDGIWNAIKASCILAGARTLAGALVPLVGAAPTNFNFMPGDYSRARGLKGDGSTKYLNSNRANNADPQDSFHLAAFASSVGTSGYALGAGGADVGSSLLGLGAVVQRSRTSTLFSTLATSTGFLGHSRIVSNSFTYRASGVNNVVLYASEAPFSGAILVFARGTAAAPAAISNGRLAFYSIGESLNLALLDARVTALVNAIAAAIPFDFLDPANLGQPIAGGYFGGLISHTADGNPTHALIVASAATGATGTGYTLATNLALKTATTPTAGANSLFDGAANTAAMVAEGIANHPAAQFCYNLSIGGFNDFYLPAQLEHDIVYFNLKPTTSGNATLTGANPYSVPLRTENYTTATPAKTTVSWFQEGGAEAFSTVGHWASNEASTTAARQFRYTNASTPQITKTVEGAVRAFRRIAL